ncbi:hypothetical protein B0T11DRAFT_347626 [Plectosphaerella cucumerina]|uniref:IPT/TIG domain-containing protein n=1 Tax=Plectosphaerella cucumerina TaxID=40658 RepID=A0A8K0TRT3_9PEZI|nr:hypothetical protein B0T11DRAFT_347626 [Plectosphaerella cucumerina]
MTANDFDDFVEFDDDETLGAAVAVAFPHDLDLTQDHHQKTFNQQLFQNSQSAHSILGAIDLGAVGAAESPDSSVREADSVSAKRDGCKAALTNGDGRMMDAAHDQRKTEWVLSSAQIVPQGLNAHLVQGEGDRSIMSLGESSVHPAPPASSGTPQSSLNLQPLPRAQPTPNKHPVSVSGPRPAATSRTTSPSLNMGPATKKWKASGSTVPRDKTMTRLDTSSSPQMPPPPLPARVSSTASLYSQSPQRFQTSEATYGSGPGAANLQQPCLNAMPTTNGWDQNVLSNGQRSASMDNPSMAVFSAPISAHPGRAPTPNVLSPIGPPPSLAQAYSAQLPTMTAAPTQPLQNQSPPPPPCIHKIIPGEGLKMGGIEVTILGSNFTQELVVYFGDAKAITTTYWGDSSLVCLLPSSFGPGVVPVTLRHMHSAHLPFTFHLNHFFRYLDDEERQITKMILGIISQKMMGELLDVKELAVKVLGTAETDWSALVSSGTSGFGDTAPEQGRRW